MSKSKIEWTDDVWNPVWGCPGGCDYCYARGIAKRFAKPMAEREAKARHANTRRQAEIEYNFRIFFQTFLYSQFRKKLPKKPKRIFIGSMSDIAYWDDSWLFYVAKKIKEYPQHTFLLLTKQPEVYATLDKIMPKNVWFGVTITEQHLCEKKVVKIPSLSYSRKTFVSLEPLLEEINPTVLFCFDWIIIGTMSGKKRRPAKAEWISRIIKAAARWETPVFVKQLEIDGKVVKDIEKFPAELQVRQFPDFAK